VLVVRYVASQFSVNVIRISVLLERSELEITANRQTDGLSVDEEFRLGQH